VWPCVSIVLPTYNGADYLGESIRSCLQQTFSDLELIVVVDGSVDNTDEVLAAFDDPRIKIVKKANGGLPRALNTGFDYAQGRYWTWTSDDNLFESKAIERMVAYLEERPDVPMVSTDYRVVDGSGAEVGYSRRYVACFLYRAEIARKVGEYRPAFALVEDTDYWHRLEAIAGPMGRLHEPLYQYRVHGRSLSSRRTGERALRLAEMYLDLHHSGLVSEHLGLRLADCMRQAALYRSWESVSGIADRAGDSGLEIAPLFAVLADALRTTPGWWAVRVGSFAYGRILASWDSAMRHREGTRTV
jgi:glycosyltransferase involved in cell wall biosynthesis